MRACTSCSRQIYINGTINSSFHNYYHCYHPYVSRTHCLHSYNLVSACIYALGKCNTQSLKFSIPCQPVRILPCHTVYAQRMPFSPMVLPQLPKSFYHLLINKCFSMVTSQRFSFLYLYYQLESRYGPLSVAQCHMTEEKRGSHLKPNTKHNCFRITNCSSIQ